MLVQPDVRPCCVLHIEYRAVNCGCGCEYDSSATDFAFHRALREITVSETTCPSDSVRQLLTSSEVVIDPVRLSSHSS